jgi:hypothetical protein
VAAAAVVMVDLLVVVGGELVSVKIPRRVDLVND